MTVLLALLTGSLIILYLTIGVIRFPKIGIWLVALSATITTFAWLPGLELLGFTFYLLDMVTLILAAAVMFRSLLSLSVPGHATLMLILLTFALLRGLMEFGPEQAMNASRTLLYFLVPLAFAQVCLSKEALPTVRRAWMTSAAVLLFSAVIFWLQNGIGTYASEGTRALNSAQALFVALAGLLALRTNSLWARGFSIACFMAVFASQQRTVWAATVFAVVVIATRSSRRSKGRFVSTIRYGIFVGVITATLLLALGPAEMERSTSIAITNISPESGTFGWRIQGWMKLLEDFRDNPWFQQILGQPAGAGFDRFIGGFLVKVSPHNMYIAVLVSLGFVGLLLFAAMMVRAVRLSRRSSEPVLLALVLSFLVFAIGYQLGPEHGLLVGLALNQKRQRSPKLESGATSSHS